MYGRIGEALKDNTQVAALSVNLDELYDQYADGDMERYNDPDFVEGAKKINDLVREGKRSASSLLEYIATSSVLKKLYLDSGDGAWNKVNGKLAAAFFTAAADNPNSALKELHLRRWECIDLSRVQFARLLKKSRTLERLWLNNGIPRTTNHPTNEIEFYSCSPWLPDALLSSQSLEVVQLVKDRRRGFSTAVFQEIAELASVPSVRFTVQYNF
jgi:hypothetical protein